MGGVEVLRCGGGGFRGSTGVFLASANEVLEFVTGCETGHMAINVEDGGEPIGRGVERVTPDESGGPGGEPVEQVRSHESRCLERNE